MSDSGPDLTASVAADLAREWSNGSAPAWENATVPEYLNALARWLPDSGGYYANRGEDRPSDVWTVVRDALRAAVAYE
jgi:hypothetical protein